MCESCIRRAEERIEQLEETNRALTLELDAVYSMLDEARDLAQMLRADRPLTRGQKKLWRSVFGS